MPWDFAATISGALASWDREFEINGEKIIATDNQVEVVLTFAQLLASFAKDNMIEFLAQTGMNDIEKFLNE
jgi:hypothetical protein